MTILFSPYHDYSRGIRGIRRILNQYPVPKKKGSTKRAFPCKILMSGKAHVPTDRPILLIQWGKGQVEAKTPNVKELNSEKAVANLVNKRRFFETVGVSVAIPEWTTDESVARGWVQEKRNSKICARYKLTGSGGEGLVLWQRDDGESKFPTGAPLYTRYTPKTHEYRVHVARDPVTKEFVILLAQRKVFQKTTERPAPASWLIRNHDNGFIYSQVNDQDPLPQQAALLVPAFMKKHFPSVDFCAVDVCFHEKHQRAFILEGNTAPGLSDISAPIYAQWFKRVYDVWSLNRDLDTTGKR